MPDLPEEAVDRLHFALDQQDAGWHYTCYHDDPKECWKGDQARGMLRDALTAALPAIGEWLAGEVCPPRTEQFWPSDAALEIADLIRRLTGAEADRG